MSAEEIMSKKGSVFGATFLITGSCVGAGMLALPISTGLAGFFPSFAMFFLAWFFMTSTAFILVEVQRHFPTRVNFAGMVEHFLGPVGRMVCFVLYLLLFYAILVAYLAQIGEHIGSYVQLGVPAFPEWGGSVLFAAVFGGVIYLSTGFVDRTNRLFMYGKILTFFALLYFGFSHINPSLLAYSDFSYVLQGLPVLVISFGFHNILPTIHDYLGGDVRRVRASVIAGSLCTLTIYLVWQTVALGNLPVTGPISITSSYAEGIDAAGALKNLLGFSGLGTIASVLAFFAITTSFLAQSLSLVHFLTDALKVEVGKRENIWMCFLTFVPPTIVCVLNPRILYQALGLGGGIFAVILFGILPVLMVWRGKTRDHLFKERNFFTKNAVLLTLFAIASFIIAYQIYAEI